MFWFCELGRCKYCFGFIEASAWGATQCNKIAKRHLALVSFRPKYRLVFCNLLFARIFFSNPDTKRANMTVQASLYGADYKCKSVKIKMSKILAILKKIPSSLINKEFALNAGSDDLG